MFTLDFKKFKLITATLVTVGLLYVGLHVGLYRLVAWSETHTDAYPYRLEDWLRYLLPNRFEHFSSDTVILIGESAVRENLLHRRFNRAFPSTQTYQGSLSIGTIDDILVALEYLQKAYKMVDLPRAVVLGLTPRAVANIPDVRALIPAVDQYSPFFRVEQTITGPHLVPKTWWESVRSRAQFFLSKSPQRYKTAFMAYFGYLLPYKYGPEPCIRSSPSPDWPLQPSEWREGLACGVWMYTSPYKYHHQPPRSLATLQRWLDTPGFPRSKLQDWNPVEHAKTVRARFERLVELTIDRGIRLYVVEMPEHEVSLRRYRPDYLKSYQELMQSVLTDIPYLDLREMLAPYEFHDMVHATWPGAIRVTDRVIDWLREHGESSWDESK